MAVSHQTLRAFIECLRRVQNDQGLTTVNLKLKKVHKKKKKKYIGIENQIFKLVSDYKNHNLVF